MPGEIIQDEIRDAPEPLRDLQFRVCFSPSAHRGRFAALGVADNAPTVARILDCTSSATRSRNNLVDRNTGTPIAGGGYCHRPNF
jgi:hypothetical protein